jgi:hypothetical protein
MIGLLRFIGLVNAALWLGSALFFTFVAGPAFFSDDMYRIVTKPYAGLVAQLVISRLFVLHYVCGGIAVLHLVAEFIYLGRPIDRIIALLLVFLLSFSLLGGLWLQPRLRALYAVKIGPGFSQVQRDAAAKSFGPWHGVSQAANLLVLAGLVAYFWLNCNATAAPRFVSTGKFRG